VSRLIEVSSISSGRSVSAHQGVSALSPGELDSFFSISLARAKRKVLTRYQARGENGIGSGGEAASERRAYSCLLQYFLLYKQDYLIEAIVVELVTLMCARG
jgi:hypothetical protein